MSNGESLTTPAQLLQRIITTSAGMVLGVVIVWTVSSVAELRTDVDVMQSRKYPPKWASDKLKFLEDEQRRCQMQIDRLESQHDGVEQQPLRPYSLSEPDVYDDLMTEDFGYDNVCFLGAECRDDSDCNSGGGDCYCDGGYCTNGDA